MFAAFPQGVTEAPSAISVELSVLVWSDISHRGALHVEPRAALTH